MSTINSRKKPDLKKCSGDSFAHGNNKLEVLSYFSSHIESMERFTVAEIYVIDCSQGNMWSDHTAIKLHIDESVKRVTNQRHRRIPYHMRKKVKDELKRLEELDIIEKVKGPTPWISPIVGVPKKIKKTIRICADMRQTNRAIEKEITQFELLDCIIKVNKLSTRVVVVYRPPPSCKNGFRYEDFALEWASYI